MATHDTTKPRPPHEVFAEQIVEGLKQGTEPFLKPWAPGHYHLPRNPASGTVYQGVNRLMLSRYGYADPRWVTLKQANEEGFRVHKGEKSQPIVFWQWDKEVPVLDAQGKPVLDDDGKPVKETVKLERPRQRYYSIFHMSQLDGEVPPFDTTKEIPTWDRHERAAAILKNSGATIKHDQRDRAFYRGSSDDIHLPPQGNFDSADKYYATALHELMHWSGHASRMNREKGPFGSEEYAREELRAEIASGMLGMELGIGHDPSQHLSYVGSWVKVIEKDPYEIVRACRDAEKMKEYVLAMEHNQELGQEAALSVQESRQEQLMAERDRLNSERDILIQRLDALAISPMSMRDHMQESHKLSEQFGKLDAELFKLENELDQLQQVQGPDQASDKQALKLSWDGVAPEIAKEKTYLNVPYEEKDRARMAGAKWDGKAKRWFAPEGADLAKLQAWRIAKKPEPIRTMDPQQEFAHALRAAGLDLGSQLPIMDGAIHRVPVVGGKPQARDGAYQGYLDGQPNGWHQNFLTGEKVKWIASGHTLTPEQRTALQQEAEQRSRQRALERAAQHDQVAEVCRQHFSALPTIRPMAAINNPYLLKKGIPPLGGIKESSDAKLLLIPLHNADGELRNVQEIDWSGTKRFQADGEKKGCFCLIDPEEKLNRGEILVAEGYATGVSLHMATGKPVAVAFDAGNLEPVAQALRAHHPEAKIAICADNDHHQDRQARALHGNVGVEKAMQAAKAISGCVIVPSLTLEEMKKGLTDFNDLHQARGLDAVKAQVIPVLETSKCRGLER